MTSLPSTSPLSSPLSNHNNHNNVSFYGQAPSHCKQKQSSHVNTHQQQQHVNTNTFTNTTTTTTTTINTPTTHNTHQQKSIMSGVEISFEALLDSQVYREKFKQYLRSIHNLDPFLFLERVEEFQVTRSTENRYLLAQSIFQDFIMANSEYEINLSQVQRGNALADFAKCSMTQCSKFLFDSLVGAIILELKEDSFLNFTRSESFFEDLILDQSRMRQVGIVNNGMTKSSSSTTSSSSPTTSTSSTLVTSMTNSSSNSRTSDSDRSPSCEFGPDSPMSPNNNNDNNNNNSGAMFVHSCPTPSPLPRSSSSSTSNMSMMMMDLDFQMNSSVIPQEMKQWILRQAYDSNCNNWTSLSSPTAREVSEGRKRLQILKNKSLVTLKDVPGKYLCVKKEGLLPFSIHDCVYAYVDCDYQVVIDPTLLLSKHLAFSPSIQSSKDTNQLDQFSHTVIQYTRASGFGRKKKERVQSVALLPVETGYLLIKKSVWQDNQIPSNVMRDVSISGTLFEKVSEKLTKCTRIVLDDGSRFQGWFSGTKKIVKQSEELYRRIQEAVATRKLFYSAQAPVPQQSHKIFDTLLQNSVLNKGGFK